MTEPTPTPQAVPAHHPPPPGGPGGKQHRKPPRSRDSANRLSVGRDLLGLAFLLVLASFVVAIAFFSTAKDVVTVMGPITTLVGTLIGTMFGVQTANQGRDEQTAQQQHTTKLAVASALVQPGSEEAKTLVARLMDDSSPRGNPTWEE
jgi:hypothetical protein